MDYVRTHHNKKRSRRNTDIKMSVNPATSRHIIASLEALEQFASQLAPQLIPGDVLALNGPMGAGKTTLTQLLGKHLGLQEKVTSPTFVLIHDYLSGSVPVVHADLYRLGTEGSNSLATELLDLLEESSAIVIVEWAEYGKFLEPYITLKLDLDYNSESSLPDQRIIHVTSHRPELHLPNDPTF